MKEKNKVISEKTRETAELALSCLFYIFAAAYIPIALYLPMNEWLSAVIALTVCVLGVAVLAKIAHGVRNIIGYIIIVGIFVLFGGMLLPIGIFSAFASASCVFAYLISKKRAPFVWGIPAIPLIISILIVKSVTGAVLSLFALPCSVMLAWAVKDKCGRVEAVCRISFGICLSAVLLFMCTVYSAYGEISVQNAKLLIEAAREQVTVILNSATEEIGSVLGYDLTSVGITNIIDVSVSSLFNLLPALVITLANISAYIIHSLYLSVIYTTEEEKKEALPMLSLDMSLASAILYIVSMILAFVLTSDKTAIYGTAAENLMLVLAPGLILTALAGIRTLTSRRGPSCLGTLLYLGVIFLLVSLSVYAIVGVSLVGAILIILANIAKKKSNDKQ